MGRKSGDLGIISVGYCPSTTLRTRLRSIFYSHKSCCTWFERSRNPHIHTHDIEVDMAFMYILECADGTYYTGSTKDLTRRLWQHQNSLGAKYTAKRLPVQLVYCEFFDRVADAFEREKQIQGWSRQKKQALINGDYDRLHQLAECQNETHYLRAKVEDSIDRR